MMTVFDPICLFCNGKTMRESFRVYCDRCGIGLSAYNGYNFFRITYDYQLTWSSRDQMILSTKNGDIAIPFFDPYNMSLNVLKEKLRLYALFS